MFQILAHGFPSGSAVKNPPASSGDMGLIPGAGGSHMPWSNYAGVPQLLKPTPPRACAPQQEEPEHRNRAALLAAARGMPVQRQRPSTVKHK